MTNNVKLNNEQRTKCEIWTRAMGYHRPTSSFNKGKKSEAAERKYFTECSALNSMNCCGFKKIA